MRGLFGRSSRAYFPRSQSDLLVFQVQPRSVSSNIFDGSLLLLNGSTLLTKMPLQTFHLSFIIRPYAISYGGASSTIAPSASPSSSSSTRLPNSTPSHGTITNSFKLPGFSTPSGSCETYKSATTDQSLEGCANPCSYYLGILLYALRSNSLLHRHQMLYDA